MTRNSKRPNQSVYARGNDIYPYLHQHHHLLLNKHLLPLIQPLPTYTTAVYTRTHNMNASSTLARHAPATLARSGRPHVSPTVRLLTCYPRARSTVRLESSTTLPWTPTSNTAVQRRWAHAETRSASRGDTLFPSALESSHSSTSSNTNEPVTFASSASAAAASSSSSKDSGISARKAGKTIGLKGKKNAITLTPSAVSRLKELASPPTSSSEPQLLRISVRNRGCAGLAYHLSYLPIDSVQKFDEIVEQDGVKVLVDSRALFSIIGSEMDWLEDRMSARFTFKK